MHSLINDRAAWLQGPSVTCSNPPPKNGHTWRLVLLGAPGVGKGTQGELLAHQLGACHLSTGDVFRAAKNLPAGNISHAMQAALGYMQRGELVPDATVLEMVRERSRCLSCVGGFLLDGFPRTVAQADAMETMLHQLGIELDAVLDYQLPTEEIVNRLSGRRTCSACKTVFHLVSRPPKKHGICDRCGKPLIQREDDRPEASRVRMEAYQQSTRPLEDFYARLGMLVTVDASGTPDEVFQKSMKLLSV